MVAAASLLPPPNPAPSGIRLTQGDRQIHGSLGLFQHQLRRPIDQIRLICRQCGMVATQGDPAEAAGLDGEGEFVFKSDRVHQRPDGMKAIRTPHQGREESD